MALVNCVLCGKDDAQAFLPVNKVPDTHACDQCVLSIQQIHHRFYRQESFISRLWTELLVWLVIAKKKNIRILKGSGFLASNRPQIDNTRNTLFYSWYKAKTNPDIPLTF